jgi:hypothetical protein|tara:strand:+ start:9509 stop:10003 length:495 start_codon:yes stop_codon:yes gene_type:complete
MNIFYVDKDPANAAMCLPDKLVVKMPLESAQMLSTAHRLLSGDDYCDERGIYLKAYMNHPCTIWARETSQNYLWLYYHFYFLCREYETRYDRQHLSFTKLNDALSQLPLNIPDAGLTTMPQAMPDEYKNNDPVQAYRDYVVNEKTYAQWNKIPSRQPEWWKIAS